MATISSTYKKGDKTKRNNCRGILFSSTFKILSSVILSMLNIYVDEIIKGNQFQKNTDYVYSIRHILEKNENTVG